MTQRNNMQTGDFPQRPDAFAATNGQNTVTTLAESIAKWAAPQFRNRRATRIAAVLPIEVRDQFGGREETRTQFLMIRGAVLATTSNARIGSKLTIQNMKSGRIAECHVIGVEPVVKGIHQVEVEFTRPQPDFWPVQFPADEVKASEAHDDSSMPFSSMHSSAPATNGNGTHRAQKPEPDPLLEIEKSKMSSLNLEPEPSLRPQSNDDQIVVLADSLAASFTPTNTLSPERYSSKTAPLDSVAQFRAANRAAHRREQRMKVFYSFLFIAVLGGGIMGYRDWDRHQAEGPHTNVVTAPAQTSAPAASSARAAHAADIQSVPVNVPTAPANPVVPAPEQAQATTVASPAVRATPVEDKPEQKEVAVRRGAMSSGMRKSAEQDEEEPMALPLRAGGDAAQTKPEVLNSVVAPVAVKSPVLAPQPLKKAMPAKLLHSVPPQYPPMARQIRAEGDVVLEIDISASGSVSDARVVSGPAMLRAAAIDAVRRWKYQPATLGDKPVSSIETVKVDFHLR